MALSYLLDGYNIVKCVNKLADLPFEEGRQTLVTWIERCRPHGSSQNSVTVIFDGRPGPSGGPLSGEVRIIFSQEESADDRIKRLVHESANPKTMVVVTNDRDIRLHVRPLGAKILTVDEFMALGKRPTVGGREKAVPGEEKYIPKTTEYKITEEFEHLWLTKTKPERRRSGRER